MSEVQFGRDRDEVVGAALDVIAVDGTLLLWGGEDEGEAESEG